MTVTFIKKGKVSEVFIDKMSIVLDIPTKQQWEVESNLKMLIQHEGKQVYRPLYQYTALLYLAYPNIYGISSPPLKSRSIRCIKIIA